MDAGFRYRKLKNDAWRAQRKFFMVHLLHQPFVEDILTWLSIRYYRFKTRNRPKPKVKILFYPMWPYHIPFVMHQLCLALNYEMVHNPKRKFDIAINWLDRTYRKPVKILRKIKRDKPVINYNCTDVSKAMVAKIHAAVFGYRIDVDPLTYAGPAVVKSDKNATHDGEVVTCPIKKTKKGFVYQRLVSNIVKGDLIKEIRVPVFGERIPLVIEKYRPIERRFDRKNKIMKVRMTDEVFSDVEIRQLFKFARLAGIDAGEMDVIRDNDNGKIYVVDFTTTSGSLPVGMPKPQSDQVFKAYCDSFKELVEKMISGD